MFDDKIVVSTVVRHSTSWWQMSLLVRDKVLIIVPFLLIKSSYACISVIRVLAMVPMRRSMHVHIPAKQQRNLPVQAYKRGDTQPQSGIGVGYKGRRLTQLNVHILTTIQPFILLLKQPPSSSFVTPIHLLHLIPCAHLCLLYVFS
jgi:hypothetical protein